MKNKIVLSAILVAVIAVGAALYYKNLKKEEALKQEGQTKEEVAEEKKKVRLVLLDGVTDVNFIVDFATDKGIFSDNGLEVEVILAEKQPDQILMAGEADVSVGTFISTLGAYLSEAEPRLLATPINGFDSVFVSRLSKENVKDIKRAAVGRFGSGGHFNVDSALRSFGLDVDRDVELVAISGEGPRLQALAKGEVDFISLRSEQALQNIEGGENFAVYYPEEITKEIDYIRDIITSPKALTEKPEELKAFIISFYQAFEYLSKNPQEARDYIASRYAFSAEEAGKFYGRFEKAREGVSFIPDPSKWSNVIERVKKLVEPTNPDKDINGLIYDVFAKEAVAAGN